MWFFSATSWVWMVPLAATPLAPPKRSPIRVFTAGAGAPASAVMALVSKVSARGLQLASAAPHGRLMLAGAFGGGSGTPTTVLWTSTLRTDR